MSQVSHEFSDPQPIEEVHRHLLHNVSPFLAGWGYKLQTQDARNFTFQRAYRPTWVIVVCILLFPIGLLALFAGKKLDTLFVSLSPDGPHATLTTFSGEVPDGLRSAILRLPEQGDRVSAHEAAGLRE